VKGFTYMVIIILLLVIIMPSVIIRGCRRQEEPSQDYIVRVYIDGQKRLAAMRLEDYTIGVVAAEMPANFHLEALKAQAVAARTYVVKRTKQSGGSGCALHPPADVCTDSTHCQAWLSKDELAKKWGPLGYIAFHRKIEKAVRDTRGLVIVHEGKLIDPVFHSTSGGKTENSEDVWSESVPYLRSVTSKYEQHSPKFVSTKVVPKEEFVKILKSKYPDINLDVKSVAKQVKVVEESTGGKVKILNVGGVVIKGTEFRSLFALNSADFSITELGEAIKITTTGYGHGVGMSQYGADGMAKKGADFKEIITHFYTGVNIVEITSIVSK
jgi:stage II sporulation protein D